MFLRFCAIVAALVLSGCTGPGSPELRTEADSTGPLIPKCQNVSPTARVEAFDTSNYLTTWGSAWYEGASQGFDEGLAGGGPVAEAVRQVVLHPTANKDDVFASLPRVIQPFCRSYNASFAAVSAAMANVLPSLGYPILTSNAQIGVFLTGPVTRQGFGVRWRDSYVMTVTPLGLQTEVKVLRLVFISRDGVAYNQGISVGQNETWVFTQIDDRLLREPLIPPPDAPKPSRRHRRK